MPVKPLLDEEQSFCYLRRSAREQRPEALTQRRAKGSAPRNAAGGLWKSMLPFIVLFSFCTTSALSYPPSPHRQLTGRRVLRSSPPLSSLAHLDPICPLLLPARRRSATKGRSRMAEAAQEKASESQGRACAVCASQASPRCCSGCGKVD